MKTSISAGIAGCFFVAGHVDFLLAEGEPIPDLRHSFTNPVGSADFQSMAIPKPPTTAIAGVALNMKRPALQAM